VIAHVFACDYDGTLAAHGRIAEPTRAALLRVRESGRRLVLVTGRMLPDLLAVCPETDRLFDAVVAENGAVLYFPAARELRVLGAAPEPGFIEALRARGVPFDIGSAMVATLEPHAEACLDAIRAAGVERTLVFNKGSLMLLPGGVTKHTGLAAALEALELSLHNTVAIGDAENDHAFLAVAECAVAVADAVPALRERADHVTRAPDGDGVVEFVEEHLLRDLADLLPRLARHRIELGARADGAPVTLGAHGTRLLVVGPSASGKSTLTGVLIERLVEAGRTVCLLDPEGDYQTLGDLEGVVVLGGRGEQTLPAPGELEQLIRQPRTSLVLNLSAMTRAEKVTYGAQALATVAAVQAATGMPHWLVIDEAHHLFPADGSAAVDLLAPGTEALCLITLGADDLARPVRDLVNVVASTEAEAFRTAVGRLTGVPAPSLPGAPVLAQNEVVLGWLDGSAPVRFHPRRRRVQHRRHVRKYTEGELPPERSFYFRGPQGALRLRAANLIRFVELAEGVDEATWRHHLGRGDYSAWLRDMIKDPDLAAEIAGLERTGPGGPDSRRAVLDAIRRTYSV
jgi:hydroxymethylpyrimidine pyrophosphatase-like HAD family hydrolase/energy-coupling factor transporter ATP-binding protein EcfA2